MTYDAVILGGGPASLFAALVLGRSRRRVLVCDPGKPRNLSSHAMYAYLSRDGIEPAEFLRIARERLVPYGVELLLPEAVEVSPTTGGFRVVLGDGRAVTCRNLGSRPASSIACGYRGSPGSLRKEHLSPSLLRRMGVARPAARRVRSRPDGVQARPRPSHVEPRRRGVHGEERARSAGGIGRRSRGKAFSSARSRSCGSRRKTEPSPHRLRRRGASRAGGPPFRDGQYQRSPLAERLGCEFNARGTVRTKRVGGTRVPGLFVAGDASEDVQLIVVAAAEGAKAAMAINRALQKEDVARGR